MATIKDEKVTLVTAILDWRWLSAQTVVIAMGLLLISVASSGSRMSAPWAVTVFWVGYFLLMSTPILRLSSRRVSRQERILTLLFLGMALYCVKILFFPNYFALNDELQHWRSAEDSIQNGVLFQYNSLLPVSSYFPGLESITNGFAFLASLDIFDAGIVVIGFTRILSLLGLFLLFEYLSKSSYVASIGSLVYIAHPGFVLDYSQFAYEPLAVSLMILVLYFSWRRVKWDEARRRLSLLVVALLCIAGVVVTHHVTSYSMAILFVVWGIVKFLMSAFIRRKVRYSFDIIPEWRSGPVLLAVLIAGGCVAWLALVSPIVIPYISVPVKNGFTQTIQVLLGEVAPRVFFQSSRGSVSPFLKIPSYLSVVFLILSLPLGLLAIWRKQRASSLALAMAVMAMGYFVSQALRLAPLGMSLTNRLASIVFLPLSYVLAVGAHEYFRPRFLKGIWQYVLNAWLLVIIAGSSTAVFSAWPLPGPFDPDVFTRHLDAENISSVEWSRDVLKPKHRFGADYINTLLLGSYGYQILATDLSDNIFIEESIYLSSQFGVSEKNVLQKGGVEYLVIDTRLENQQVLGPIRPDSPVLLTNLDELETIDRVYDGGNIIIYHLGFVDQLSSTENTDVPVAP